MFIRVHTHTHMQMYKIYAHTSGNMEILMKSGRFGDEFPPPFTPSDTLSPPHNTIHKMKHGEQAEML